MKSFKQHVQMLTEAKEKFPVNQGHAYEFVLAAAMIARFTDRYDGGEPMALTPKSVMKVMEEYYRGNIYWQVAEGDEEIDIVEFDGGGLPQEVHDALSQDKIRKHPAVKKMIESAIKAVTNNQTLTKLSLGVITNHKADEIEVRCGGTKGQNKTKSDIDVYVNDKDQRIKGFSVKYGGTQQGGQFAGKDAVKNLINGFSSFNIDVKGMMSPVEKAMKDIVGVYESPASADDPVIISDKAIMFPAVKSAFRSVSKKYTSKELKKPKITDALMKGLRKANFGEEDDVQVIRGKSITYDNKTFEGFGKYISDAASQGNAEFRLERDALATLGLYANGNKMFQLRFRYDRDKQRDGSYQVRFRLYVENGRFLDTLAGEI
jgi:hypothetical protein